VNEMAVFYDRATIQVKAGKGGDGMENTYQTEARLVETAVKAEVSFLKSIQDLEPY